MTGKAVLYLRSSKDRSDVSIDAQRRELRQLAATKGLQVVGEHADVVVSGKDDQRPAFQALLAELKHASRPWSAILMFDTSRLARNQAVAHVFRHECRKRNVDVLFAMTPELDGVAGIMMPAVLHAFDEVHSYLSKEKGLAGMAENVRRGFRAGGRAPFGYRLEHTATGAVREGAPVMKSRLVPDGDRAQLIAAYLQGRAAGTGRRILTQRLDLTLSDPTLIGIEWNALTYAGATVWNVHAERIHGGGYKGGRKRRPRDEWVIQKATHPALISEADAEAVLQHLTSQNRTKRVHANDYLLSGMLFTPDGQAWRASPVDGVRYYRAGKAKRVRADDLERQVVTHALGELRTPAFLAGLLTEARRLAASHAPAERLEELRGRAATLGSQIRRYGELAAQAPAPRVFFDRIAECEAERDQLQAELAELERQAAQRTQLASIGERDVARALDALQVDFDAASPGTLKEMLGHAIERIELEPAPLRCRILYRIHTAAGFRLASPRRTEPNTCLRIWQAMPLAA